MKAYTIRQPAATLVATARQRVINSPVPTEHRGPLAIHVGPPRSDLIKLVGPLGRAEVGKVIAVVRLVVCVHLRDVYYGLAPKGCEWVASHEYAIGPYCWVLDDVHAVRPVQTEGRPGLWDWEPDTEIAPAW